ncbi:MAG: HEAT repeat domain-containing protein [Methanocalculaceae archaeon]|jgi:HEAT repeat protein|nr:HEAT repeat domain-containing protein [Methanocalculaceae archaeon]
MCDSQRSPTELTVLLYDPEKCVRSAAAQELGRLGRSGFAAVRPLLADASWVVRYRACEAVGMIKLPEAYQVLLETLADPHGHVRYMAVKGLGLLGDARALPDVQQLLEDENPFVRRIAKKVARDLSGSR